MLSYSVNVHLTQMQRSVMIKLLNGWKLRAISERAVIHHPADKLTIPIPVHSFRSMLVNGYIDLQPPNEYKLTKVGVWLASNTKGVYVEENKVCHLNKHGEMTPRLKALYDTLPPQFGWREAMTYVRSCHTIRRLIDQGIENGLLKQDQATRKYHKTTNPAEG